MITNDKRQDGYLFVLDTIEGTEESLANWQSRTIGVGEIPPPQLLYVYNGARPVRRTNEEVRDLKQRVELTAVGESKIDGVVSKLASLSTSMETKFEEKIGEARTILSEKMEGVFAQQQKDNQEFQRELILGNQAFQANMFNMFVTTQQDTVNYINESHKGINKLS
jgi:hypothetical protein